MIELHELKLSDILPERLKTDEVIALANALDGELQEITKAIDEVIMMPNIMGQPEDIVDSLAWQLHVDFYEPLGLNLDKKRALVKNSLIWHRHKGTKYVLEDMIRILFLEDFSIEEWFEYGGEPYFFRIISNDSMTDLRQYEDLIRAIYKLKNERSWLESLRFNRKSRAAIYVGTVARRTRKYEVDGTHPQVKISPVTLHIGIAGKRIRRFEITGTLPSSREVAPAALQIGIVGKEVSKFEIDARKVGIQMGDAVISSGLIQKRTSKNRIISSKEVGDSGNIQS